VIVVVAVTRPLVIITRGSLLLERQLSQQLELEHEFELEELEQQHHHQYPKATSKLAAQFLE
jgi:hypothetical protein